MFHQWLRYICSWHGSETNSIDDILVINGVSTKETGAASGELESFHCEGEVLIIGIIYQESVVDVLLKACGFIALRYKRAGITSSKTFLNTGGLGESLVVSFDVIDDNSPFALSVDSTERLDIDSLRGTEIGLFLQSIRSLYREFSVKINHISVEAPDFLEMMIYSSFDFIGWVFCIFKAPSFGVVDGTGGFASFVCGSGFVGRLMVGRAVVRWSWVV